MAKMRMPLNYDQLYKKMVNFLEEKVNNKTYNIDIEKIISSVNFVRNRLELVDSIYDLLPDIKLTVEMIVSSILSPNDMLVPNLNVTFDDIQLPSSVKLIISDKIRKHINEHYQINDKLKTIIEEALFTKGAYIELIFPATVVEKMLDSKYKNMVKGFESFVNSIPPVTLNVKTPFMEITDNPGIVLADEYYKDIFAAGYESAFSVIDDKKTDVLAILDQEEVSKKPIIKKLPVESVLPVIDKNDPSNHYGYFIFLDAIGRPLNRQQITGPIKDFIENKNQSSIDKIITKAKKLIQGLTKEPPVIKELEDIKNVLVLENLKKSLKKTGLDVVAEVGDSKNARILDIALDMILKDKKVKVLFVPNNYLQYFAIHYRKNGVGLPLLEKISLLASMKAMILFVELMSFIKSSIPQTRVSVTMDESDINPEATMEKIISEVMKSRQLTMPVGLMKVDDIADWVHKVGFVFDFNHPQLPDVKIDIQETSLEIKQIDSDVKEKIDKLIYKALGIPPELVDEGFNPEFATTIVTNNILFTRKILAYQAVFNKHFTDYYKKIIKLDQELIDEINATIKANMSDIKKYIRANIKNKEIKDKILSLNDDDFILYIREKVIRKLNVKLPEPVVNENDNIADKFDDFKTKLEDLLDTFITTDIMPDELVGELGDKAEQVVKNTVKAIILKKWLIEHNYMTELVEVFSIDDTGKPLNSIMDEFKAYIESIEKSLIPFLKEMTKFKNKSDEAIEKATSEAEEEEEIENEETENEETENEETNEENNNETENNETEEEGPAEPKLPEE